MYASDTALNLSTLDEIHLKGDVLDGSVVNGLKQPIFHSFVLDKLAGSISIYLKKF